MLCCHKVFFHCKSVSLTFWSLHQYKFFGDCLSTAGYVFPHETIFLPSIELKFSNFVQNYLENEMKIFLIKFETLKNIVFVLMFVC